MVNNGKWKEKHLKSKVNNLKAVTCLKEIGGLYPAFGGDWIRCMTLKESSEPRIKECLVGDVWQENSKESDDKATAQFWVIASMTHVYTLTLGSSLKKKAEVWKGTPVPTGRW